MNQDTLKLLIDWWIKNVSARYPLRLRIGLSIAFASIVIGLALLLR